MSKNSKKLTSRLLYRLVLEEKEKYEKDLVAAAKKTREVDAGDYANTLEKEIDYLAVLKIKEALAKKSLKSILEQKAQAKKRLRRFKG